MNKIILYAVLSQELSAQSQDVTFTEILEMGRAPQDWDCETDGFQIPNWDEIEFPARLVTPRDQRHKVRIRIRANAYRFQSSAVIERWNGEEWKEVYRLAPGAMSTAEGLYVRYKNPVNRNALNEFADDRLELIARAQEILF